MIKDVSGSKVDQGSSHLEMSFELTSEGRRELAM